MRRHRLRVNGGAALQAPASPSASRPLQQRAAGTADRGVGQRSARSPDNTDLYLILPLTRYNAFARGNYEINDWVGVFGQALFSHTNTYTRNEPGPITNGWDVFLPYGTGTYVGSDGLAGQRHVIGTGNPSSVILNGMPTRLAGCAYVDPTPAILTDNPTNPAFATLYGSAVRLRATPRSGGCTNNQVIGQFLAGSDVASTGGSYWRGSEPEPPCRS